MPNPTVPAAAPGLPSAQIPSRRGLPKAGTAAVTMAMLSAPVAALPREAEAAPASTGPIPALWKKWQALKPEHERLTVEAEAARARYRSARPPLPHEAYAIPPHFGLGVHFPELTPVGELRRWGFASHWRKVAEAFAGIEYMEGMRADALHRATIMDRWEAECDALLRSTGVTEAEGRAGAYEEELDVLEEQILAEPIRTLGDARIQVSILKEYVQFGGTQLLTAFFDRVERAGLQSGGAHD